MENSDSYSFFKNAGKKAGKIAAYTAYGTVMGGLGSGVVAVALVVPAPVAPVIAPALILPCMAGGAALGGIVGFFGAICCPDTSGEVFGLDEISCSR